MPAEGPPSNCAVELTTDTELFYQQVKTEDQFKVDSSSCDETDLCLIKQEDPLGADATELIVKQEGNSDELSTSLKSFCSELSSSKDNSAKTFLGSKVCQKPSTLSETIRKEVIGWVDSKGNFYPQDTCAATEGEVNKNDLAQLECHSCEYKSLSKKLLIKHIEEQHGSHNYVANKSGLNSKSTKDMANHNKTEQTDTEHSVLYNCQHCNYSSKLKTALAKHTRQVHTNKKHSCDQCPFTTRYPDYLAMHKTRRHTLDKKYCCELCMNFSTNEVKRLRNHKRKVHDIIHLYSCPHCPYKNEKIWPLNKHVKAVHSTSAFKCDKCSFTTGLKAYFEKHAKSVHTDVGYKCLECDYRSTIKASLNYHIQSKHSNVVHNCSQCSYSSTVLENLKKHEKNTHSDIMHHCDRCEYKNKHKKYLLHHIQSEHLGLNYTCRDCGEVYKSKHYMRLHIRRKHNKTTLGVNDSAPTKVDPVKKAKKTRIKSKLNKVRKGPAEVFICELCGHKFSRNNILREHMESQHLGVVHNCDQCSFTTNKAKHLLHHKRVEHEGVRYKCDKCEYVATWAYILKTHKKRKHSGEVTMYSCEHCDYKTDNKYYIKQHTQAQHEGVFYGCDQCNFRSAYMTVINKHKKAEHVDK